MNDTSDKQERALALIRSTAHEGDHDFEGAQLDAWEAMRGALLVALAYMAAGLGVPHEVWRVARNSACPKEAVPEEIEESDEVQCDNCGETHDCRQTVRNPEWSGGTMEGERWASEAKRLLDGAVIGD